MNDGKEIRFIEMFAGIGGFRLGLEQSNKAFRWWRNTEGATGQEDLFKEGDFSKSSKSEKKRSEDNGLERANNFEETQSKRNQKSRSDMSNINRESSTQWRSKHAFSCVWANEKDKYATAIYCKNFGEKELVEADIRAIKTEDIPEADLLVGGFPCQTFSVAGKRKGFKDTRGTLFFEIARVAEAKRPKILLLENVKGLLSAQEGYCFWRILQVLDELGYDCEWQVLNSKHFGVPQNRERVFIVGHLRGKGGEQIFPITEGCEVSLSENSRESETEKGIWSGDISPTIDGRYGALRNAGEPYIAQTLESSYHKTKSFVNMLATKTATIRRLTPTECERLQGFPDGWTEGISDTQRYKCLGNAVTVNVIEFLGERILKCFGGKDAQ